LRCAHEVYYILRQPLAIYRAWGGPYYNARQMASRSVIIVALFLLCEGILFSVYCLHPGWSDNIKFGATVVAATFALFEFLQKNQHDRSESAGEFMKRWNDPGLYSVRLEVRAILTNALLLQPLIKTSNNPAQFTEEQNAKRGQLIGVLNFFEELALAVHRRRADERYLYGFFSDTVRMVWEKFQPWIKADRTYNGGTEPPVPAAAPPKENTDLWCEFERLENKWKKPPRWWV